MNKTTKILVLLGPPGSGKGTVAEGLKERGYVHFSTGEAFRAAVASGSELGKKVEEYLSKGELVPDSLVNELVVEKLQEFTGRKIVLDGYPRTAAQASFLFEFSLRENFDFQKAIYLNVEDETIVRRLSGRRVCKNCGKVYNIYSRPSKAGDRCEVCGGVLVQRDDDREEVVRRRLEVYHRTAEPLLNYLRERGLLEEVDASGSPEDVLNAVLEKVGGV